MRGELPVVLSPVAGRDGVSECSGVVVDGIGGVTGDGRGGVGSCLALEGSDPVGVPDVEGLDGLGEFVPVGFVGEFPRAVGSLEFVGVAGLLSGGSEDGAFVAGARGESVVVVGASLRTTGAVVVCGVAVPGALVGWPVPLSGGVWTGVTGPLEFGFAGVVPGVVAGELGVRGLEFVNGLLLGRLAGVPGVLAPEFAGRGFVVEFPRGVLGVPLVGDAAGLDLFGGTSIGICSALCASFDGRFMMMIPATIAITPPPSASANFVGIRLPSLTDAAASEAAPRCAHYTRRSFRGIARISERKIAVNRIFTAVASA